MCCLNSVVYSALRRVVCGDGTTKCGTLRLHLAAVKISTQLRTPKVKPAFASTEYQKKGEICFAESKDRDFFIPSRSLFFFFTPKQADKPKAKTNVANNRLKIVSYLTTSCA